MRRYRPDRPGPSVAVDEAPAGSRRLQGAGVNACGVARGAQLRASALGDPDVVGQTLAIFEVDHSPSALLKIAATFLTAPAARRSPPAPGSCAAGRAQAPGSACNPVASPVGWHWLLQARPVRPLRWPATSPAPSEIHPVPGTMRFDPSLPSTRSRSPPPDAIPPFASEPIPDPTAPALANAATSGHPNLQPAQPLPPLHFQAATAALSRGP